MEVISKLDDILADLDSCISLGTIEEIQSDSNDESKYDVTYKWTINNSRNINTILYTKSIKEHESDSFDIAGCTYCIRIHPNGCKTDKNGSFALHLQLISLPLKWKSLFIKFSVKCEETGHEFTIFKSLKSGKSAGTNRLMPLKQLKDINPEQITFIYNIDIIRIKTSDLKPQILQIKKTESYNEYTKIDWKIDANMVKAARLENIGNSLQSKIHDNMWMMECYQSGGYIVYQLSLCYLPLNVSKMIVEWRLYSKETNTDKTITDELTMTNNKISWLSNAKYVDMLQCYTECNTLSEITILDEYNMKNNNYLSMQQTETEWNKFAENIKTQKAASINSNIATIVIYGYIRNIEEILKYEYNNNPYYNIPYSMGNIIISYIGDHFLLDRGIYVWFINNSSKTKAVLNASVGKEFDSSIFSVGYLNWIIELVPNQKPKDDGITGLGGIYLRLLAMPSKWNTLYVLVTFECPQIHRKFTLSMDYNHHELLNGWGPRLFATMKQLKYYNPNQLTFIVTIKILKITLKDLELPLYRMRFENYKRNTRIEWIVTQNLMRSLDVNTLYNSIQSDIYDIWMIQCRLQKNNTSNDIYLAAGLKLAILPKDNIKLKVRWSIHCDEFNITKTYLDVFHEKASSCYWNCNNVYWEEIQQHHKTLTFSVDIQIEEEFTA